ncbi:MAG: type II toxin-antitoxin system HicA family toxin [Rhodococcus sp. (in: high G+C Gram-positive bacteria)]|uniref:type II toxin-antitoxin system HicA family toxin n=1 Tax=Rhodococcus sp. TaxID=1831 RepID=UPI003BB12896
MTKRAELLKEIRAFAKDAGLDIVETEGGSHTKVVVGGRRTVVARHGEIPEVTAKAIRKQLGMTETRQGKGRK